MPKVHQVVPPAFTQEPLGPGAPRMQTLGLALLVAMGLIALGVAASSNGEPL